MTSDPGVQPILRLQDVSVRYGAAIGLSSLDLEIGEGEIVSLLGGNASGKSTTMKVILGVVTPSAGRVSYQGTDITTLDTPARVRAGIASVPEARRVFAPMSVEENLLVGAYTQRDRRALRDDLAAQYDRFPRLRERRNQAAGTLSGGEQQMLAFARALMSRPKLICMDEPTMGLSPKLVDQVLLAIEQLNQDLGIAVLLVEQQAELALSIANRGYVLTTGELSLAGPAADLLHDERIQEAYLGKHITNGDIYAL